VNPASRTVSAQTGFYAVTCLLCLALAAPAYAVIFCSQGTILTGGCSDPQTVLSGNPVVYNVWGIDKDQPMLGGSELMDQTLREDDHEINSMLTHATNLQGDDPASGKRTWTVSGMSPVFSEPDPPQTIYDLFWFNDTGGPASGCPDIFYFNDDRAGPFTKTVTINPRPT
jgi:hypothetical protein